MRKQKESIFDNKEYYYEKSAKIYISCLFLFHCSTCTENGCLTCYGGTFNNKGKCKNWYYFFLYKLNSGMLFIYQEMIVINFWKNEKLQMFNIILNNTVFKMDWFTMRLVSYLYFNNFVNDNMILKICKTLMLMTTIYVILSILIYKYVIDQNSAAFSTFDKATKENLQIIRFRTMLL